MSFWMGMARGFKDADDKKTQDRRITEERAYDAQVREDARKFETGMFWTKLAETRRDAFIQARAARDASSLSVDPEARRSLTLLGARLEGVEGGEELMNAAIQDPTVAATIIGTIQEAEKTAAEKGQKGFRISGQQLVDNFNVYGFEGVMTDIPTMEDIMSADMNDPVVFADMTERMAAGSGANFGVDVNAGIFHQPNIAQEEYTREVFDEAVIESARLEAVRLADEGDVEGSAVLLDKIRTAQEDQGAVERLELREQFGDTAKANLEQFPSTQGVSSNPGISSAPAATPAPEETSEIRSFTSVEEIQAAINRREINEGDTVLLNGTQVPIAFE